MGKCAYLCEWASYWVSVCVCALTAEQKVYGSMTSCWRVLYPLPCSSQTLLEEEIKKGDENMKRRKVEIHITASPWRVPIATDFLLSCMIMSVFIYLILFQFVNCSLPLIQICTQAHAFMHLNVRSPEFLTRFPESGAFIEHVSLRVSVLLPSMIVSSHQSWIKAQTTPGRQLFQGPHLSALSKTMSQHLLHSLWTKLISIQKCVNIPPGYSLMLS